MSTENAEVPVETTETIDWEQRARKAEAKIVDMKKSVTPKEEEPNEEKPQEAMTKDQLEAFYAEKKFFENNPDMMEYKDKITEYTSKGIDFEKAKLLVEADDETIRNRKVASQMNFTSGDTPAKTSYSQSDLLKMSQRDYNKVMELKAEGKVTIT